jgi:hypothetical protein
VITPTRAAYESMAEADPVDVAYDVRPEVAEQVQSLGAKWLDLGIEAAGCGHGDRGSRLEHDLSVSGGVRSTCPRREEPW